MNVVHVMPSLDRAFGGPIEALFGYVAAARAAGLVSTVIAPRERKTEWRWLQQEMPEAILLSAGLAFAPRVCAAPAVARAVRLAAGPAAVVHVHGTLDPVTAAAGYAALAAERPLVVAPFGTLSDYTFTHGRRVRKRWYFRAIDAPLLRRSTLHFASERERIEAVRRGIDLGDRSHVVPPPWRTPSAGDAAASGRTTRTTILFLGRLHPIKGVEVLLDAWPAIRARCGDARLVIAGGGAPGYVATLRARARALPDGDRDVLFPGLVAGSERARCLAEAAVCVLPSRQESFGIAVLDAVGAGVPVVVSAAVALASFLIDAGMGVVADRSPAALADAVASAWHDGALRARVALDGRDAVRRRFAPEAVAPALVAMYEGAVLAHGRPARAA